VLLHQFFLAAADGNPGFKAQLILMMAIAASEAAMLTNGRNKGYASCAPII
jgi:hypothetical protein